MQSLDDPMQEWERIARNRPHPNIAKGLPKVTDGTTASIVQKTPRRIIQQLPTGKVHSDTNDWLTIVASFIFTNKIIPHANADYNLIQKCWSVVEKGLTYGSQSVHVPFLSKDGYFCTDMTVPYVKNVKYEPGKVSDLSSNWEPMEAWYQPKDIEAIIAQEKKLKAADKKYESTWDLKILGEIKDEITAKADDQLTPSERKQQNGNKGGILLVHMFQRGVGATFYTIHPKSEQIVRRKKNKDPRGEIPLITFYAGIDGSNPRGRGYVELVAPLQNLIDSQMQLFQLEQALMTAPPTIKRGNWSKSQAKLMPNVIVDLGSDPNNSWEVLKRDTSALNRFSENYGLTKSQLLNLLSSPDTSVSSDVGNPGFSKTDAGVKSLAATMSVDDNYIRKQFEAFFERWGETAINLYFAERTGIEELQLDDATAEKLRKLPKTADYDPETFVSKDNKIRINYDTETEKLKFEVDASTSNMKDDAAERDRLVELLDMSQKYPALAQILGTKGTTELVDRIIVKSGVEDPEKILPKQDVDEQGNPVQQQDEQAAAHSQEMQAAQQQIQELQQKLAEEQQVPYAQAPESIKRQKEQRAGYTPATDPSPQQQDINIKGQQAQVQAIGAAHKDATQHAQQLLPANTQTSPQDEQNPTEAESAGMQPPGITAEDQPLIAELQKAGVPEPEIGKAIAYLHHGYPPEQILSMIGVQ